MPQVQAIRKWYLGVIAFSLFGLTLQRLTGLDPGPIAPAASLALILLGFAGVSLVFGSWRALWPILVIGAASEVLGLTTGFPFGRYEYTAAWWPTIPIGNGHVFPLILPFAWAFIVGSCALLVPRTKWWPLWTGLLAAIVDLPMERAMVDVYGYWRWETPDSFFAAPWTNFLGWWAVAALALLFVRRPEAVDRGRGIFLAAFCLLTAYAGLLQFFDWSWIFLLILAVIFCWDLLRMRRTAKE